MTEFTLDASDLPANLGISRTVELAATLYRQAGLKHYSVCLPVRSLLRQLRLPDPTKPVEDNRLVSEKRASDFADYLLTRDEDPLALPWTCPPFMLRADYDEFSVSTKHDWQDGTAWVILTVNLDLLWRILDGQHRALGFKIAEDRATTYVRDARQRVAVAERNGEPEQAIRMLRNELEKWQKRLDDVSSANVNVTVVEATAEQARQMFVDIARNAKGINPDFTVVLDSRSPVHRIAVALSQSHQLLKGRVELGQEARMSSSNPNLLGAKSLADICHGVIVGPGRVSKRKEHEISAAEATYTARIEEFLDALVGGFDDLAKITNDQLTPSELRGRSLLGSSTMLRSLAIAFHDMREGDPAAGIDPMPLGDVEAYFRKLAPHMAAFEVFDVIDEATGDPIIDPKTGETKTAFGVAPTNRLWMSTGVFEPGNKAPGARQGNIKDLSGAITTWGRMGNPLL